MIVVAAAGSMPATTATSVRHALTVCRLGFALERAATKSSSTALRERVLAAAPAVVDRDARTVVSFP